MYHVVAPCKMYHVQHTMWSHYKQCTTHHMVAPCTTNTTPHVPCPMPHHKTRISLSLHLQVQWSGTVEYPISSLPPLSRDMNIIQYTAPPPHNTENNSHNKASWEIKYSIPNQIPTTALPFITKPDQRITT